MLKRINEHNPKYNVIICFIHKDIQNAKNLIAIFNDQPSASHSFILFVKDKLINNKAIKTYIEEELSFDLRDLRFIDFDGKSEFILIHIYGNFVVIIMNWVKD